MSGHRPIYRKIWKDPDFQELSPEEKLLFVYFLTNEAVSESGIYTIAPKTASFETGIPLETVSKLFDNRLSTDDKGLDNGCIKNVFYDKKNKLIYVKNIRKYNTGGNPDLIRKSITHDYNFCPHSFLWKMFFEEYPKFKNITQENPTVTQPLENGSTTVRYDNDNNNNNDKGNDKGISKGETSKKVSIER